MSGILKNRRSRPGGALALIALFVVSVACYGCASSSEVTDEPPRYVESGEDQVSQIGQGGTARVALPLSMKPDCMNPYLSVCGASGTLDGVVFEGLLAVGPSGEYRPLLSRSVPSYSDGTLSLEPATVEIRLKEDAAFSDGEPLTGRDVKWTYERAVRLAEEGRISAPYAGFRHVEEIRVEGGEDRTVVLALDGPYSEWRSLLTAPVLPEHVYGGEGKDIATAALTDEPVGSGPFRLDEFEEEWSSFTASPRYWTEDELQLPRLDGLEVVYRSTSESRESLARGEADFGLFAVGSGSDSGSLLRDSGMKSRSEILLFNSTTVSDSQRAALTQALDRREIAEVAGLQPSRSAFGAFGISGEVAAWPSEDASRSAGQTPGRELRLAYPVGGKARDRAVESVVADLESAGFAVDVRKLSRGDFHGGAMATGDFDVAVFEIGSLASYEALEPYLPAKSAFAVSSGLRQVEEQGRYVSRIQQVVADEDALVPLYVWQDSYAWSSTLSGPRPDTPARAVFWNIRDWGFFK